MEVDLISKIVFLCSLFGWPISLFVATLPPIILSNQAANQANVMYQQIRHRLMSKDPKALVATLDLQTILEMGVIQKKGFQHFRIWAFTAAIFNAVLLIMTLGSGIALVYKM